MTVTIITCGRKGKNRKVLSYSRTTSHAQRRVEVPGRPRLTGRLAIRRSLKAVVFGKQMYAKKIMKENESEEGRREAMDVAERSRECLIEWEEKQEKGEEGSLASSSGSSSSGSSSSGSNSMGRPRKRDTMKSGRSR